MVGSTSNVSTVATSKPLAMATAIGPQKVLGISGTFAAAVGMIAVFCGVTNCPITSIILSVEMFGPKGLIFFAVAVATSYMLSGYYGLYMGQKILYSKDKAEFINTSAH